MTDAKPQTAQERIQEWLKDLANGEEAFDNYEHCAKATRKEFPDVSIATIRRAIRALGWFGKSPQVRSEGKAAAANETGVEGFRKMFDVTTRVQERLQELIDGDLKERGWMYDTDVRAAVHCEASRWTNLRRDYEHLLVEVRQEGGKGTKTVWCHPDVVDECRAIAKRS